MKYGYQLTINGLRSKVYETQKDLFVAMSTHVGDQQGQLNVAGAMMQIVRVPMQ